MAKELPYFQFEPAEYLTGDISFCSLSAQGLFTILCSYYWQRSCKITKDQFLRRINNPNEFQELLDENVIQIEGNNIKIKFLDEQLEKVENKSKTNSINGSKGGRPKKEKPKETEIKPKLNQIKSETKGIREDKIKEDKIKEEYILHPLNIFIDEVKQGYHAQAIEQWYMELKIKKGSLTRLLTETFKGQLLTDEKVHENTQDLKKHFKSWLNVMDRNGKLNEYKITKKGGI